MALKFLGFSYLICFVLTLILINIYRPNSDMIFPFVILQSLAYAIMFLCTFIIGKSKISNTFLMFSISFIVSYFFLFLFLWRINGADIIQTVVDMHRGPDFMSLLVPFIASNILMLLYILISKKQYYRNG